MPSKLFQKRKDAAAKRAVREQAERKDRLRVLVVAEGSKTEPNYLSEFIKLDGLGRIEPFLTRDHATGPMKLLGQARAKLKSDSDYDFAYVISDRDEFEDFELARNASDQIKSRPSIRFIYSDPCVEIWFLLHFELHDAPLSRHDAVGKLKVHMKGYQKGSKDVASVLYGKTETAIANSIELIKRNAATGTTCPSTIMHELILELRAAG